MAHATAVTTNALGAFSMIAAATKSSAFEGETTVADLWASLPGFPTPRPLFGDRPRCLTMEAVPVVDDRRRSATALATPFHGVIRFGLDGEVTELHRMYPRASGVEFHGMRIGFFGEEQVIRFRGEDGALRPLWDVGDREWNRKDRSLSDFMVRPGIGTDRASLPSRFLTLWALMYCLSELAPYYPGTWVSALDPDRSTAAVTIEHGLDLALDEAPSLISEALSGPIPALLQQHVEDLRRDLGVEDDPAGSAEGAPAE